jgi:hypothetical protein
VKWILHSLKKVKVDIGPFIMIYIDLHLYIYMCVCVCVFKVGIYGWMNTWLAGWIGRVLPVARETQALYSGVTIDLFHWHF